MNKEKELFDRLVSLKREIVTLELDIKQLVEDFTYSKDNENGELEKDVVKEIVKCADIKAKELFGKFEEENRKREAILSKTLELSET